MDDLQTLEPEAETPTPEADETQVALIEPPDKDWPPHDPLDLPELRSFSPASVHQETAIAMTAELAAELAAIRTGVQQMASLTRENIELGLMRNDQLGKTLEHITSETDSLFGEMRDTMELMQEFLGQMDQQIGRLGVVTAGLVAAETEFRNVRIEWELEHQPRQ